MEDIVYYVQNGYHIIFISLLNYYFTNDFKFSMYVYLKWFSFNYYNSFYYLYDNSKYYRWKHMIRLTDTGHIANLLFYLYPSMLPISHNVLFVITTAYYITRTIFNLQDTDNRFQCNFINHTLQEIHCHMNHTVPYAIILYSIYDTNKKDVCFYEFNVQTYYYSVGWILCWFLCIYLPWVYVTQDYVYSVFDKKSSYFVKITVVLLVLFLLKVANEFGKKIAS